jgi:hypothetical protein
MSNQEWRRRRLSRAGEMKPVQVTLGQRLAGGETMADHFAPDGKNARGTGSGREASDGTPPPARPAVPQRVRRATRKTPAPAPSVPSGDVYQIKVTLRDSKPPIWRRLLVPGEVRLSQLHKILQVAMGWQNSHLHQFVAGERRGDETFYGVPDPDFNDLEVKDERRVRLRDIAPEAGAKFFYEYDFGDGWEHVLLVEKILPPDPSVRYPVCVKGKRACPPEDCGGVWGYADLLEALADPKHEQHQELRDWIGDDFDPEAFDLDSVNRQLQQLR